MKLQWEQEEQQKQLLQAISTKKLRKISRQEHNCIGAMEFYINQGKQHMSGGVPEQQMGLQLQPQACSEAIGKNHAPFNEMEAVHVCVLWCGGDKLR